MKTIIREYFDSQTQHTTINELTQIFGLSIKEIIEGLGYTQINKYLFRNLDTKEELIIDKYGNESSYTNSLNETFKSGYNNNGRLLFQIDTNNVYHRIYDYLIEESLRTEKLRLEYN